MTWAQCVPGNHFCFVTSDETLGVLAWVGTILTLVGLAVAIIQSRKAQTAAEAASGAVSKLQVHVDSVNLAYLSAQMNTVMHLVRKQDYEMAQIVFAPIKRSIRLYANANGIEELSIEALRRTMGKIDIQLEWGRTSHTKFSSMSAHKHLDDLLSRLADWESVISDVRRTEISSENA